MQHINIRKAILSSLICNSLVWYDYVLFGSLSGIIGNLFFPSGDKYLNLIAALIVFAVGFLMRPLGASFFGNMGDKYGRKIALLLSIISMSIPVAIMVVVPTYQAVGIVSTLLLILCRLIQGFSLGGETGNATFLIEHSEDGKRRGLFGSFEVLSAVLGSGLSLVMISICEYFLKDEFSVWGWRLPFVVGLILGLVSIYIRYITDESPDFEKCKERDELSDSPIKELFRNHRRALLIAIGVDGMENAAFYMFMVFFSVFIATIHPEKSAVSTRLIEIFNITIAGLLTLTFGWLSDIWGRKTVMSMAAGVFIIIAVPVFQMLTSDSEGFIQLAYIIFAIPFAASLGPSSAAISELFPTNVRYTGFALARNISGAMFGGFAPAICMWLFKATNMKIAPAFYMIFCALIGAYALSRIKHTDLFLHDE